MTVTLSVTGNPVIGYSLRVNCGSGEGALGYVCTITRYDDETTGDSVTPVASVVRGAESFTLVGNDMYFYDYEAPIGEGHYFYLDRDGVGNLAIASAPVIEAPFGFAIIHSVLEPRSRAAGAVLQFDSWSRETRVLGNHAILGRRNPVVTNDVLSGITGTFTMANINMWDINFDGHGPYNQLDVIDTGLDTMFDDGGVFLFRSFEPDTGVSDFYFTCTAVNTARLSRVIGFTPIAMKSYEIQFVEVDRPRPSLDNGVFMSWQDVQDVAVEIENGAPGAGWDTVTATFTLWSDVYQGDLTDDI